MYINTTDITEIIQCIRQRKSVASTTILFFIAEETPIDITALIDACNAQEIACAGGIFPQVIFQNKSYKEGIVINFIEEVVTSFVCNHLDTKDFSIPKVSLDKNHSYCAFTFVDGLSSNISHYLSELYRQFGNSSSYLGGGAGSLTLIQKPCIFTNDGFFQNAAICLLFKCQVSIGVKHGWKKISGPVIATKTNKNVIEQINWMNALDVYKSIIEPDSSTTLKIDNFFDIAKGYPFGIIKEDAECVVRDPIATNERGELICVGEVPENTVLDVLKGENNALISSAEQAASHALNASKHPQNAFIIDCISRVLFLEDEFPKELNSTVQALQQKSNDIPIAGALTLGEISSYNGYLEFFNKTIVVGLLE